MKKLLFLMMALLVAPAMAAITVEVVDNGDLTADIEISATETDADTFGSLLAGIAFDASVDGGAIIEEVVAGSFKVGESEVGDKGYGIYLGTIFIEDGAVVDPGGPVAPADDPDSPPQLPGPECILEFAALYNVNTPEAAPEATATKLCTIKVDQGTTLTLSLNGTRGEAALIGGGTPSGVDFVGGAIGGPLPHLTLETAVFPAGHPREGENYYQDWLDAGSPDCWAYPRQCWGDADGKMYSGKWVFNPDLTEFINSWNKDPGEDGFNICADFDHAFYSGKRVFNPDLTIFIASWNQDIPGNCGGSLVPPE